MRLYKPVVLPDDPEDGGKAEADSLLAGFCGEERVEDARKDGLLYALPRVSEREKDVLPGLQVPLALAVPCSDDLIPCCFNVAWRFMAPND